MYELEYNLVMYERISTTTRVDIIFILTFLIHDIHTYII